MKWEKAFKRAEERITIMKVNTVGVSVQKQREKVVRCFEKWQGL